MVTGWLVLLATKLLAQPIEVDPGPTPKPDHRNQAVNLALGQCHGLIRDDPLKAYDRAQVLIHLRPQDPRPLHCQAMALLAMDRHADGARILTDLADSIPVDSPDYKLFLRQSGQAWLLADKPASSARQMSLLIMLDRDDVAAWIDRGISYAQGDLSVRALSDFNRAIAIDPTRIEAYILRAVVARRLGRYDQSAQDLAYVLSRNRDDIDALFERGWLHYVRGQYDAAIKDWTRVNSLDRKGSLGQVAGDNVTRLSDGQFRDVDRPRSSLP